MEAGTSKLELLEQDASSHEGFCGCSVCKQGILVLLQHVDGYVQPREAPESLDETPPCPFGEVSQAASVSLRAPLEANKALHERQDLKTHGQRAKSQGRRQRGGGHR